MKKKKILAMLTVLAMTAGLAAGCGNSGNSGESGAAEPSGNAAEAEGAEESGQASASGEAEAVTIWYYWETEGHQVALDQVIQDYNESQSQYEVTAKYVPFADFKKQLSIGASADELPDLAILDSPDHASYAQMGIFEDVTGLAFSSVQNEEGTFNFVPWLWSTGATSYDVNNENGIRALTYVQDLVKEEVMSKECINWTQGDVMNQFISGNVAMMVNGPWQIPTMQSEAPDLNWKVTLIPKDTQYASCLGGENYAVINGGNVDGALDFLTYATAEEQVKYLMDKFGYISADQKIAETQFAEDSPYQPVSYTHLTLPTTSQV